MRKIGQCWIIVRITSVGKLVCFKISSYLGISMEVYVMTDTQIESYAYEDQMTPKFTKLYVGCESETT